MLIKHKLALVLMLFAWLMIAIIFSLMGQRLQHGFLAYLQQQQLIVVQDLSEVLTLRYPNASQWQALKADKSRWQRSIMQARRELDPRSYSGLKQNQHLLAKPKRDKHKSHYKRHKRAPIVPVLIDYQQSLDPRFSDWLLIAVPATQALPQAQQLFITVEPITRLKHWLDRAFIKQQQRMFMYLALFSALLSAVVAWPLAKLLVGPVEQLSSQMKRLSQRDYSQALQPKGRDELAQLATQFNHMAATLGLYDQQQRQWLSDIAHELRTPVAIMQAELEALIDGVRTLDQQAMGSLHEEITALAGLIDDLHFLAKADAGQLQYEYKCLDLTEFVSHFCQHLATRFSQQGLTLNARFTEPLQVLADGMRLRQVLMNLAQNSLRYTDSPGRVEVSVVKSQGECVIQWQDTSPGLDVEQVERIFDRLYRVEASRNKQLAGSGLGLAIVASIVGAHQGQVSAAGSGLGGVLIEIRLPLASEQIV